jgi:hypothetical protein
MIRVVSGFDVEIVMSSAVSVRNPYYKIVLSLFARICFVNGISETKTKIARLGWPCKFLNASSGP